MTDDGRCEGCRNAVPYPIDFTMAFHPIVDVAAGGVWGYEALVRGTGGESAGQVLAALTPQTLYSFDQACRVKAIALAGEHMAPGSTARLSINFMPQAVYEPRACIQASLKAARRHGFDPRRLMFEFTENERVVDVDHVRSIIAAYRHMGFTTAIDDFGAGHAGLNLLAQLEPDIIKIDMDLIRNLDTSRTRDVIVRGIAEIARALGITVIAEGIETRAELDALRAIGITLVQGYYFARPTIEAFSLADDIPHLVAA